MNTYAPPFKLTNTMLDLVASISEKVGRITTGKNLESKPHLRKNNRVKSIYSSLKIEANSLTIGQVRDVINGKIVLGKQKEIQEVKNAFDAYERIKEIDPYDIEELKHIHGIMTKYLIDESGCFRHGEEGVFNGEECIFMAPPARFVPHLMEELFDWMEREKEEVHPLMNELFGWMKKEKDQMHPLILSSVFHYEFVFIHPFADGNGRMARLWHTCLLANWKPFFQYIPIESQIERFQEEYYNVIAQCHVNGDSNLFIEFMLRQIDQILKEVLLQSEGQRENISEYVKRLLDVMEYEVPYTAVTLMELLGLKSKESFRKNYLNPAIELQLIRMTVPDKPRSRNQRYVKR